MQPENPDIRRAKRHDHIAINLRVQVGTDWRRIKANDWNEVGFNFYSDADLTADEALFAKGAALFSGEIVWRYKNQDDGVVLEMIFNRLLIGHLGRVVTDRESMRRVLRLVRATGLTAEKRRLLTCLGKALTKEEEARSIEKSRLEYPLYRYGVRVEAKEWTEVVRFTLETTSVLDVIEQINSSLDQVDRR